MAKLKSRPARWAEAAGNAREAFDALQVAIDDNKDALEAALSELRELQEEYEQWRDNMPEGLQQSATGEKLSAIVDDLEIPEEVEVDLSELDEAISNAEGMELPLGFGKD
jgi:predicted  nucleic acid-binding Zn-ribbon protein